MIEREIIFKPGSLEEFGMRCLVRQGMRQDDAETVSKSLVQTDKWGVHSHGMKNLLSYIRKAAEGGVSFTDRPEICQALPSLLLIDGRNTMGFVSASFAMEQACRLAEETGIGMAVVKNSCHFGAAGCYSNIAAQNDMLGGAFSNVDPFMTIPGAQRAVMGQNPMSLAAPATHIPSVMLDISTSHVASLRVIHAKNEGVPIPKDWIIDKDGNPTDDPSHYPEEGALQPMAAHKGYGIALFIEMITSVMSGGLLSMSGQIPSWNLKLDQPNGVSHALLAINPDKMMGSGYLRRRADEVIRAIHDAPKAKGVERLFVPGEMAWERSAHADRYGLSLPEFVYKELLRLSDFTGVALPMPDSGEER